MSQQGIDLLNRARARELTAISQYMAQHYELEDAMYGKLAERIKKIAMVEMKHAEEFAERIIFLGGIPVSKPDVPITKKQLKVYDDMYHELFNETIREQVFADVESWLNVQLKEDGQTTRPYSVRTTAMHAAAGA